MPGEAAIMLQQGFELYPLGELKKKMVDHSDRRYCAVRGNEGALERRVLGVVTDSGTQFILQWTGT